MDRRGVGRKRAPKAIRLERTAGAFDEGNAPTAILERCEAAGREADPNAQAFRLERGEFERAGDRDRLVDHASRSRVVAVACSGLGCLGERDAAFDAPIAQAFHRLVERSAGLCHAAEGKVGGAQHEQPPTALDRAGSIVESGGLRFARLAMRVDHAERCPRLAAAKENAGEGSGGPGALADETGREKTLESALEFESGLDEQTGGREEFRLLGAKAGDIAKRSGSLMTAPGPLVARRGVAQSAEPTHEIGEIPLDDRRGPLESERRQRAERRAERRFGLLESTELQEDFASIAFELGERRRLRGEGSDASIEVFEGPSRLVSGLL
jgi:hypothetical protein